MSRKLMLSPEEALKKKLFSLQSSSSLHWLVVKALMKVDLLMLMMVDIQMPEKANLST